MFQFSFNPVETYVEVKEYEYVERNKTPRGNKFKIG